MESLDNKTFCEVNLMMSKLIVVTFLNYIYGSNYSISNEAVDPTLYLVSFVSCKS